MEQQLEIDNLINSRSRTRQKQELGYYINMCFSLNYNTINGEVEVKHGQTAIDSWPKQTSIDFTQYCIVGDKDVNNTSYHSRLVPVTDNKPYKKTTSDDSSFCCVYVAGYDRGRINNPYDSCRVAKVYSRSSLLTSFQGSKIPCTRHHFTFLTLPPSEMTAVENSLVYLIAATDTTMKVFKLTGYNEKDTVCWTFGSIARLGVSPATATGKRYFDRHRELVNGCPGYMYLADCEKIVSSGSISSIRDRHCVSLQSDYDSVLLTVSEDDGGLVPVIPSDRHSEHDDYNDHNQHRYCYYGWDELLKFGDSKLRWYDSCVISQQKIIAANSNVESVAEADYLMNKLFSPESLTSGKVMEGVRVEIAADSDDDFKTMFSRLCQYRKPTLMMIDRPYNQQTADEASPDGYTDYDSLLQRNHVDQHSVQDKYNSRAGYNLYHLNFLNLHVKSLPSYLDRFGYSDQPKHTIKVAVFDGVIPSLTDYFENHDNVITADNTLYITCTVSNQQLMLTMSKTI